MLLLVRFFILICLITFLGCTEGSLAYNPAIIDVAFPSSEAAMIVTKKGQLQWLSADETKRQLPIGLNEVRNVEYVGNQIPTASDANGDIWVFYGQNWTKVGRNPELALPVAELNLVDKEIGWVRTLESLSLTEDGGRNWKIVFRTEAGQLRHLYTVDRDTSYLFGNQGKILATYDRGVTWKSLDLPYKVDITAFACRESDPRTCWIGTSEGAIYISGSGRMEQINYLNEASRGVFSIYLGKDDRVLIAGTSYSNSQRSDSVGFVISSNDNGKSWQTLKVPADRRFNKVVAFGNVIWLAGDARIYRSEDNGITWKTQFSQF